MEFETETNMKISFADWTDKEKLDLIHVIVNNLTWDFEGMVYVDIEPPSL